MEVYMVKQCTLILVKRMHENSLLFLNIIPQLDIFLNGFTWEQRTLSDLFWSNNAKTLLA